MTLGDCFNLKQFWFVNKWLYTVSELRSTLVAFPELRESSGESSEAVDHVYRSLFGISEKDPSTAIAEIISNELN